MSFSVVAHQQSATERHSRVTLTTRERCFRKLDIILRGRWGHNESVWRESSYGEKITKGPSTPRRLSFIKFKDCRRFLMVETQNVSSKVHKSLSYSWSMKTATRLWSIVYIYFRSKIPPTRFASQLGREWYDGARGEDGARWEDGAKATAMTKNQNTAPFHRHNHDDMQNQQTSGLRNEDTNETSK